jgi:hypothetical protein
VELLIQTLKGESTIMIKTIVDGRETRYNDEEVEFWKHIYFQALENLKKSFPTTAYYTTIPER